VETHAKQSVFTTTLADAEHARSTINPTIAALQSQAIRENKLLVVIKGFRAKLRKHGHRTSSSHHGDLHPNRTQHVPRRVLPPPRCWPQHVPCQRLPPRQVGQLQEEQRPGLLRGRQAVPAVPVLAAGDREHQGRADAQQLREGQGRRGAVGVRQRVPQQRGEGRGVVNGVVQQHGALRPPYQDRRRQRQLRVRQGGGVRILNARRT
jgi:hypothetical protein